MMSRDLRLAREAARGNIHAIKEIADRLDGKAVQPHGQDTDLGPITVLYTGFAFATSKLITFLIQPWHRVFGTLPYAWRFFDTLRMSDNRAPAKGWRT
jgi:hypothetical protein